MRENNELAVVHATPAVKDGAEEELFKRMRALEEVVKGEREEAEKKAHEKYVLDGRGKYHEAIAVLCAKYSKLDREVVARLSDEDRESLADSIAEEVRKKRGWKRLFGCMCFVTAISAPGLLAWFVYPEFLFLYAVSVILGVKWPLSENANAFLDFREQTEKADRIALEEAKPDGT